MSFRKLPPRAQHLAASINFAEQYKQTCVANIIFSKSSDFWDDQYQGVVERLEELQEAYQKALSDSGLNYE